MTPLLAPKALYSPSYQCQNQNGGPHSHQSLLSQGSWALAVGIEKNQLPQRPFELGGDGDGLLDRDRPSPSSSEYLLLPGWVPFPGRIQIIRCFIQHFTETDFCVAKAMWVAGCLVISILEDRRSFPMPVSLIVRFWAVSPLSSRPLSPQLQGQ